MNLIDKYSEMYNHIEEKPISNNIISILSDVHKHKMTRKKQKNNNSGTTGISFDSKRNRWKSYIMRNNISKFKYFDNQAEAIEWRRRQEEYYTKYRVLSSSI